jgi:hypothetical protein
MGYRCFDLDITDQVAHLVLNRPEKRNSMIPEFWDELPAAVRDIDENARARDRDLLDRAPFHRGPRHHVLRRGRRGAGRRKR